MKLNDLIASVRELYQQFALPVCRKYALTSMEFNVLLFLANNPEYDTAAQIVEKRRLTKSHVSISVRALRERGYLACSCEGPDRRAVHLKPLAAAEPVIADGRAAQEQFTQALLAGFSDEEQSRMQENFRRMEANIAACLAGRES